MASSSSAETESPVKKLCLEESKIDSGKSFTAREYQIEILEAAKQRNTIACLGTGTGKTFIAVMLIRENSNDLRLPYDAGGKRIFFLVPTVPLVTQQSTTIEQHTDLRVKGYYGDMDVDSWKESQWVEEFRKHEVLVMTAEIFRIIISHAFISLAKIKLIIFDECHRAQGDHPYRQAMKCISDQSAELMPRVFGLSASLLNGKCKPIELEKRLLDLEKTLRSTITTASDITDLQKYGTDPDEYVIYYQGDNNSIYQDLSVKIESLVSRIKTDLNLKARSENSKCMVFPHDENVVFFDKPVKCLNQLLAILTNLGIWCAYKAAEIFCKEIDLLMLRPFNEKYLGRLKEVQSFLSYFMEKCDNTDIQISVDNLTRLPKKLQRLLELFAHIQVSKKFAFNPDKSNFSDLTFDDDPENYRKKIKNLQERKGCLPIFSIIFVEQRITAYVLCQFVLEVTKKIPAFEFMKPAFMVGHGAAFKSGVGCKETSMSVVKQKQVLRDFRKEKFNILIATSVLEEGMDIQQCNVVVRFDLPTDFRAYVQSKGRARAKNSVYVLLLEIADGVKFIDDMCNFKTIEKMLLTKCRDRLMPTEEDIQDHMKDDLIPPYLPFGKEGPRITMTASMSLINRYCSKLPCDMATKLTPRWDVQLVDPDSVKKEYLCKLWMPINSPIRKEIIGDPMSRKRLAKMSSALKACQQLHEIGELNEHLVPISCLVDNALKDELTVLEDEGETYGAQPGTNRRRQVYKRGVPKFLSQAKPVPLTTCYLHVFEMDLAVPLPNSLNPRKRPLINPSDTTRGFGLLATKKLPQICGFPVFTKSGKVMVNVNIIEPALFLSEMDVKKLEDFHRFVFSDVLWLENGKTFAPDAAKYSCFIVPVNRDKNSSLTYEIDWNFITMTKNHPYNAQKLQPEKGIKRTFSKTVFQEAVVIRSYVFDYKNEVPSLHFVTKIHYDKTPNSEFDDCKFETYKGYYKIKYNIDISDESQPLIETVRCGPISIWKPLYTSPKETFVNDINQLSESKLRHKNHREYLIPELCIVHPFPVAFFNKAQCLPTILFRLNSLLLAEELRENIAVNGFIGTLYLKQGFHWPVFNLETSDKKLTDHLVAIGELKYENNQSFCPQDIVKSDSKIVSFEAKMDIKVHPGPCPSLILQALTAKSVGDEFNLERLEIIGDSFLKYAMSVKTYVKYPQFDEGKLTELRIGLIRNLYLYQCAKKKNLCDYLLCTIFHCNRTWLPPCYTVEEYVDPKSVIKKAKYDKNSVVTDIHYYFKQQIISDKSIADSVEALIGAYLLSCGQQGALRFMYWFGLNPFPEKDICKNNLENWPPIPKSPIIVDFPGNHELLISLTSGYEKFESIIKYKFKNIAYLLQAFTHPSYSYNLITDCYQRQEFLGDAVLDYLVTRKLYDDPKDHTPGELTDLRSALVNNIYFASLAVKFNYHIYLKMLSPNLFRLLDEYIELLQNSDAFKMFKAHGFYLEEVECFELEEVEVPKALGDIFESVAGAIYLDSGMSLDAVWKVYYPMMKPAIDHLCKHVPKSPVRELYEYVGKSNIFGEVVVKPDKTYIEATLPDGRKFVGVGPNKKVAKRSAAKRAMAEIRKRNSDFMMEQD